MDSALGSISPTVRIFINVDLPAVIEVVAPDGKVRPLPRITEAGPTFGMFVASNATYLQRVRSTKVTLADVAGRPLPSGGPYCLADSFCGKCGEANSPGAWRWETQRSTGHFPVTGVVR